jgi:hypothetical protein
MGNSSRASSRVHAQRAATKAARQRDRAQREASRDRVRQLNARRKAAKQAGAARLAHAAGAATAGAATAGVPGAAPSDYGPGGALPPPSLARAPAPPGSPGSVAASPAAAAAAAAAAKLVGLRAPQEVRSAAPAPPPAPPSRPPAAARAAPRRPQPRPRGARASEGRENAAPPPAQPKVYSSADDVQERGRLLYELIKGKPQGVVDAAFRSLARRLRAEGIQLRWPPEARQVAADAGVPPATPVAAQGAATSEPGCPLKADGTSVIMNE